MHETVGWIDGRISRWGESRGLSADTLNGLRNELDRCGCWLKRCRPRPNLEQVDGPLLIAYIRGRTAFYAKATVAGVVSKLRGMGNYLVQQGVWTSNPMRWVRGPRIDPRGKLPRRIGREHLTRLWDAVLQNRNPYQQHLSLAVLALLYGTGLRRGELECERRRRVGVKVAMENSGPGEARRARVFQADWTWSFIR